MPLMYRTIKFLVFRHVELLKGIEQGVRISLILAIRVRVGSRRSFGCAPTDRRLSLVLAVTNPFIMLVVRMLSISRAIVCELVKTGQARLIEEQLNLQDMQLLSERGVQLRTRKVSIQTLFA